MSDPPDGVEAQAAGATHPGTGGPTAPRGSQLGEALDLFRRNRDFRNLFLAATTSYLGDWFALVAVSGLVKEVTGSDGATALVFAFETLPVFLFAPLAGILADRFDRRRLMQASLALRVLPALALVVASTTSTAWLAFACVGTISALAAFSEPIPPAAVPNLVEPEDLSLAQTILGSVWGTMLFLGAAIGGLAAAVLGREASFVLNALTFVVAVVLVQRIRAPFSIARLRATGASVLAHVTDVWAFVRDRKPTRALMTTKAGVGTGNGVVGLLPAYAIGVYGAGDAGIGALLAARGLGALVGPWVGRRIVRGRGQRLVGTLGISIIGFALTYLVMPAAPVFWVAVGAVLVAHLFAGHQWVASTEGLQRTTPDDVRGRVMSLDFALATLSMGSSAVLGSILAEAVGLAAATRLMAGVALVYGLTWLWWTRDLWRATADPLTIAEDAGTD
ncbi:MFS transporter [Salsipaludibacter albus]|uniref:MFS transporter n=1 Tax=Salsipaludibacter albus TaxID=2849650 RepID=UPI001EE447C4|nr:MFS transporter [Salsipaludibacter albus]